MVQRLFIRLFSTVFVFAALTLPAPAQYAGGDYVRLTPDQADRVFEDFRQSGLGGDACFDFTITHRLQKSDVETQYLGTLWLSRKGSGQIVRVEINKAGDKPESARRFILPGGAMPVLWVLDDKGKPVESTEQTLKPLFPGLIFSPFELQTPFTHWPRKYEQTTRFRGRPTHVFAMTPPAEFKAEHPEIGFVKLSFDRAYNALIQAIIFDKDAKPLRRLDAERFAKVQEQYVPEEIRLRDERTRDKDILRFTHAALRLKLPAAVFDPATLVAPAERPLPEKFSPTE